MLLLAAAGAVAHEPQQNILADGNVQLHGSGGI
jgi:hypothetical protein